MKTKFVFLLLIIPMTLCANGAPSLDSAQKKKSEKASNLKLTTRIHSMGQFAYGGRIVSVNPTLDFNLNYDRKTWGFQIFKAMDLKDRSTQINFTLAVVNKNFHFGKRLTVTPSAGFILEQSKTMADRGSDVVFIVATAYKLSREWTVDYTTLFGNMVLEPEEKDWVNRVRIVYSKKHVDLMASCWHNNKVFDTAEYLTFGASAFYSRVKLSESVVINAGATLLLMPYSNDEAAYPKRNGLVFTLGLMLD